MDVAAEASIVAFVLDGVEFVSSLIEMTRASIPFGVPVGIATEPMLHPASEIRLRCANQSVNVVWHSAVGDDLPTASVDLLSESLGEAIVVPFIME